MLNNLTHGSLEVKCTAGKDGGLQQSFILEVMDTTGAYDLSGITTLSDQAEHSTPLFRVLGDSPIFRLHSLRPRRDYQLVVYAQNAKGRSKPPVVLSNVRIELPADVGDDIENGELFQVQFPPWWDEMQAVNLITRDSVTIFWGCGDGVGLHVWIGIGQLIALPGALVNHRKMIWVLVTL